MLQKIQKTSQTLGIAQTLVSHISVSFELNLFSARQNDANFFPPDEKDLDCFGPFCSEINQFTTQVNNLPDKTKSTNFGGCSDSELVDDGCPVLLSYRLKIGQGLSPPSSNPTHKLWIRNQNDNSLLAESRIIAADSYGPFPKSETVFLSTENPIKINDPDIDAKTIAVRLSAPESQSSFLIDRALLDELDDPHFGFTSRCLFTGCQSNFTVFAEFVGTQTQVNRLLSQLQFRFEGEEEEDPERSLSLTIELQIPFKSGNRTDFQGTLETKVVELKLDARNGQGQIGSLNQAEFFAILITFLILLLMCFISFCRNTGQLGLENWRFGKQVARRMQRENYIGDRREVEKSDGQEEDEEFEDR